MRIRCRPPKTCDPARRRREEPMAHHAHGSVSPTPRAPPASSISVVLRRAAGRRAAWTRFRADLHSCSRRSVSAA
eukprot:2674583-Prymnesium_polylepis.1